MRKTISKDNVVRLISAAKMATKLNPPRGWKDNLRKALEEFDLDWSSDVPVDLQVKLLGKRLRA